MLQSYINKKVNNFVVEIHSYVVIENKEQTPSDLDYCCYNLFKFSTFGGHPVSKNFKRHTWVPSKGFIELEL